MYLESFDLDELLDPVHDEDVSLFVIVGNVSWMKPAILYRFRRRLLVVQVAQHDLDQDISSYWKVILLLVP